MTSRRVTVVVSLAAAILAAGGLMLFVTAPRQEAAVSDGAAEQQVAIRVPAARVARRAAREQIEISGVIQPFRTVVLAAEVNGRVAARGAREHEAVTAEQPLLQLEDTIRRAAVDRAEAAVVRARSEHRLAELELARQRRLYAKGVSSEAERDRVASTERAAFGALGEAEAMLVEARELLAKTTVRAPFDGVLSDFDVEVGDRLEVGQRIGEVIDLAQVKIEIGVSGAQVIAVRPGEAVALALDVYPGRAFPGAIRSLGSATDPATRKFPIEVVAPNSDGLLLPGMVARAALAVGGATPVIRISRQATLEEFGLTYVFVLEADADRLVARRRRIAVRPVAFRPAEFEVLEGLADGEQIATGKLRDLRDGALVAVETAS